MSISIYKIEEYEHTHENEQFRKLCDILKERFGNTPEHNVLFANINFNGIPLDALLVKQHAIIVLEFKNYTGKVIATENGDWTLENGTIVKGGQNKNPYQQVRNNKFATVDNFNNWFPRPYVNLYHTSGVVVFNQNVEIDDTHLSPKVKTWFHITDMSHIGGMLEDITSKEINFTNNDLVKLPETFNCTSNLLETTVDSTRQPAPAETPLEEDTQQSSNDPDDIFVRVERALDETGFLTCYKKVKPEKKAVYHTEALDLSPLANEYAQRRYNGNLYEHQYLAAHAIKEGKNVCIATSTSSGKTAIFHLGALEILQKDKKAKILAIYPMKALGSQQKKEWETVSANVTCGKIDGSTPMDRRLSILRESQIVSMTPDTVHTFLLGKLKDAKFYKAIAAFLKELRLIIVDEIHLYKGMLGSNSAYMFRRLNSCIELLGNNVPLYITASATIADPQEHSKIITGIDDFELIGPDMDSSFSAETEVLLVNGKNIPALLQKISSEQSHSITFFDSRKSVSNIAMQVINNQNLKTAGFYPFKANMETEDYNDILEALQEGQFRGVISTSSLEVGIDVRGLDVAVLYGVPSSSTSFYQRMGRVGRQQGRKAVVIIVNDEQSISSQLVFKNPSRLFSLPLEEPALYLDNKNLIDIQTLHFVGTGLEFQSVCGDKRVYPSVAHWFPQSFNKQAINILDGQTSRSYNIKENEGGDYPEIAFTLRSFSVQYNTEDENGDPRGQLTMQNIMREAFPDAVYDYLDHQYRVIKVDKKDHKVCLKGIQKNNNVKFIRTEPNQHIIVVPQKNSSIYSHVKFGNVDVVNIELREMTTIDGYKEVTHYTNGHQVKRNVDYPNAPHYRQRGFTHNFGTIGILLFAPSLMNKGVQISLISTLLSNCFLNKFAFERADIEHRQGKTPFDMENVNADSKFITIYDKNEGGLNITQKLMERDVLLDGFKLMLEICKDNQEENIIGANLNDVSKDAINTIYNELKENAGETVQKNLGEHYAVAEGSNAYLLEDDPKDPNNQLKTEVTVTYVTFDTLEGIHYYNVKKTGAAKDEIDIPEDRVLPIPGVSYKALYRGHMVINTDKLW